MIDYDAIEIKIIYEINKLLHYDHNGYKKNIMIILRSQTFRASDHVQTFENLNLTNFKSEVYSSKLNYYFYGLKNNEQKKNLLTYIDKL